MSKKVELPMTTRKQMKKLKAVVGFRPKDLLKDRLQKAMDATGCEPAMLAEKCVDRALSEVVLEILHLRQAAATQFLDDEARAGQGYPHTEHDVAAMNEGKGQKPGKPETSKPPPVQYSGKPTSKRK